MSLIDSYLIKSWCHIFIHFYRNKSNIKKKHMHERGNYEEVRKGGGGLDPQFLSKCAAPIARWPVPYKELSLFQCYRLINRDIHHSKLKVSSPFRQFHSQKETVRTLSFFLYYQDMSINLDMGHIKRTIIVTIYFYPWGLLLH